jgi:hypothetical protein
MGESTQREISRLLQDVDRVARAAGFKWALKNVRDGWKVMNAWCRDFAWAELSASIVQEDDDELTFYVHMQCLVKLMDGQSALLDAWSPLQGASGWNVSMGAPRYQCASSTELAALSERILHDLNTFGFPWLEERCGAPSRAYAWLLSGKANGQGHFEDLRQGMLGRLREAIAAEEVVNS